MKLILIVFGIVGVLFAYWTISPLFIETVVDEKPTVSLSDTSQRENEEVNTPSVIQIDTDGRLQPIPSERISAPVLQEVQPRVLSGTFRDADPSHRASGMVYLSGQDVSLVDFVSTNVPDARVYLANDTDAQGGFVDLGKLKGSRGNQNYSVPSNIDIDDYKYVLIWCRAFSILVGSAQIK